MKREARLLLNKAVSSLLLSIDHFNKASDLGRSEAALIFLDHAFEMLLKASLVELGSPIREKGDAHTFGFDRCVRKALTDSKVKFLTAEQALSLQVINNYRDAAQHYLLELSEQLLYTMAQAGLSLFRTILQHVFGKDLSEYLPSRVLPVSTTPPADIDVLFQTETEAIRQLLQPGKRRRTEALARLRPLAIMEGALNGQSLTPSDEELGQLGNTLRQGKTWDEIFPSVATIGISARGTGPSIELSFVKKSGAPVELVPEGTPHASVVAVRRVNELDFYSMNLTQLREKVDLTQPKCLAVIDCLGIQGRDDCFKEIRIGKSVHKRYSQKAIEVIKEALPAIDLDEVWKAHGNSSLKSH